MTYPKMKPCPQCGAPVSRYKYESGWVRVECDSCHYIARPEGRAADAIANHNNATADKS
jgi:hypothetical protein